MRTLTIIRNAIFTLWFGILVAGFITAGGIKGINPLHLTESVVSVDEPMKYITYYLVVFLFFGLTVAIGRRAACHGICWMSPFMVGGYLAGKLMHLPQMRIKSDPLNCSGCKTCEANCPMSIPVSAQASSGEVSSLDCILCGRCVDGCPNGVLAYGIRRRATRQNSRPGPKQLEKPVSAGCLRE